MSDRHRGQTREIAQMYENESPPFAKINEIQSSPNLCTAQARVEGWFRHKQCNKEFKERERAHRKKTNIPPSPFTRSGRDVCVADTNILPLMTKPGWFSMGPELRRDFLIVWKDSGKSEKGFFYKG